MNIRSAKLDVLSIQRGLGLVELMIAMVIGLVLIGGVIQIFASNKQGYITHEALSRIQENGRYAMEIMSRNVRMAGFTGCAALDTAEPNIIANNPPQGGLTASTAVLGHEYNGSSWTPSYSGTPPSGAGGVVAGSDLINVNRGADCGAYLVGNMATDNANLQINDDNTCNFQADDVLIISDCASTDIFRASSVSSGASKITIAHANNVNTSNRLSKAYGEDARIFKLSTYDYYVALNASSEPSLYVREDNVESELVEGVEDMQITYGLDTDGDRAVDSYVDADASGLDWSEVVSVRIQLGLRSISDNIAINSSTYSFNGANETNRRLRKNMRATIGVRNRLP